MTTTTQDTTTEQDPRQRVEADIAAKREELTAARTELGRANALALRGHGPSAARGKELRLRIAELEAELQDLELTAEGIDVLDAEDRERALEARRAELRTELSTLASKASAAEKKFIRRVEAAAETAQELEALAGQIHDLGLACRRVGMNPQSVALTPARPRALFDALGMPWTVPHVAIERWKARLPNQPKPPTETDAKGAA